MNQKYEITDIAHEKYPFLHRIRALRDIGGEAKAGALGGFVEHEGNLSFEPGDDAWVSGDAIIAGMGRVDKGSILRDRAVVCGSAYASHGSVLFGDARAEDDAYIRSATLFGSARVSGVGMVLGSPDASTHAPVLSGHCCVYGKVSGRVYIGGDAVIISGEEVCNASPDVITINGASRSVSRAASRDGLEPLPSAPQKKKAQDRGRDR